MKRVTQRALPVLVPLLLAACAPPEPPAGLDGLPGARALGVSRAGIPSFVSGRLAEVTPPSGWAGTPAAEAALRPALETVGPAVAADPEDLVLRRTWTDALGLTHARYDQTAFGLPVVGAELLVHVNGAGEVYAVGGDTYPAVADAPSPSVPEAEAEAIARDGLLEVLSSRLVYALEAGRARLAWEVRVRGLGEDGVLRAERVFVDAVAGEVLSRRSELHDALDRAVYSANGGSSLPGSPVRMEGQGPSGDSSADEVYDSTGTVWHCYDDWFQRDSYDDAGHTLTSTVHFSQSAMGGPNAAWDSQSQGMIYTDGDGQYMYDLALGYDVTAHELTHAVTERTANLTYQDESGALNEAFSDIMGATCEAYRDGGITANTWKIGEQIAIPGVFPGDALRFMDDPVADGVSADFWPNRCLSSTDQNCAYDSGGVHTNSGIANLAFVLAVEGGRHPRSRTSVLVPAQGLPTARDIFYRALTTYLTPASSFSFARIATVQSAMDLYGTSVAQGIDDAWEAVGVPQWWLDNGVPRTQLSGDGGTDLYYVLDLPAGATNLVVTTSGPTGDVDLYLSHGAIPTTQTYDQGSYGQDCNETVSVPAPAAGTWYVFVDGYSPFDGVQVEATWDAQNLAAPPKASLPLPTPTP